MTKVETDKEHVKGQKGGLNITDLETKLMFMSVLPLLGVIKSGQFSPLCHFSSSFGLFQKAIFTKLPPHSLTQQ